MATEKKLIWKGIFQGYDQHRPGCSQSGFFKEVFAKGLLVNGSTRRLAGWFLKSKV